MEEVKVSHDTFILWCGFEHSLRGHFEQIVLINWTRENSKALWLQPINYSVFNDWATFLIILQ